MEMVHGAAGSTAFGARQHLWAPAAAGSAFDLTPSALAPLEAYRDYLTIVSNTDVEQRRGLHRARDRRRSLPLGGGVPDPGAPQADAGLRHPRRHLDRPDRGPEDRPRDADPVDAAVHRERRPGRRLLLRLLLRLHRLDQLGLADRAAADDSRPAAGVRPAVRHRRHARGPGPPPPARQEPARLRDQLGRTGSSATSAPPTSSVWPSTSTTCARSSGASRRSRR